MYFVSFTLGRHSLGVFKTFIVFDALQQLLLWHSTAGGCFSTIMVVGETSLVAITDEHAAFFSPLHQKGLNFVTGWHRHLPDPRTCMACMVLLLLMPPKRPSVLPMWLASKLSGWLPHSPAGPASHSSLAKQLVQHLYLFILSSIKILSCSLTCITSKHT